MLVEKNTRERHRHCIDFIRYSGVWCTIKATPIEREQAETNSRGGGGGGGGGNKVKPIAGGDNTNSRGTRARNINLKCNACLCQDHQNQVHSMHD